MFDSLLIANRGEIAVRIIRACREMGIRSIAVFSEADRRALHVLEADEAHCVGPPPSSESYLNVERLLEVARNAEAQAVHVLPNNRCGADYKGIDVAAESGI